MAEILKVPKEDIPYEPLLRYFKENADLNETEDPSHKHSIEYIRLNVGKNTDFFETNKNSNIEHVEQHQGMSSLKIGDEVKCLLKFKQAQLKKNRSGEYIASVQMSLDQVNIVHRGVY